MSYSRDDMIDQANVNNKNSNADGSSGNEKLMVWFLIYWDKLNQ